MASVLTIAQASTSGLVAAAQSTGTGFLGKLKTAVGMQEQEQKGLLQQVDDAVTMTWKQRMIGFGCCLGFGLLLTLLSMLMLFMMRYTQFAVLYSIGSIVSIMSTLFLMGPVKQCQRMFEEKRIFATVTYLAAIIATLVVAFTLHIAVLCLLMLVIQFAALLWYCITWIPGGQAMLKGLIFRGS